MLKGLLSLLLSLFYSKSESAEVASQSLPNETDFTSVTLNTSQPDTFVAPYDGYFCIVVDTGGSINVWGDGLQSSNYSLNNGQSKLFVPMRKGSIIGYSISGRLLFGKFYRLGGGGYSTIEKLIRSGGAICLRSLLNSSRKSFFLTGNLGSVTNLYLATLTKLSQSARFLTNSEREAQITSTTSLLRMDGSSPLRTMLPAFVIRLLIQVQGCIWVLLVTIGCGCVYQCLKGKRWTYTLSQKQELQSRSDFVHQTDLQIRTIPGGVSC